MDRDNFPLHGVILFSFSLLLHFLFLFSSSLIWPSLSVVRLIDLTSNLVVFTNSYERSGNDR